MAAMNAGSRARGECVWTSSAIEGKNIHLGRTWRDICAAVEGNAADSVSCAIHTASAPAAAEIAMNRHDATMITNGEGCKTGAMGASNQAARAAAAHPAATAVHCWRTGTDEEPLFSSE